MLQEQVTCLNSESPKITRSSVHTLHNGCIHSVQAEKETHGGNMLLFGTWCNYLNFLFQTGVRLGAFQMSSVHRRLTRPAGALCSSSLASVKALKRRHQLQRVIVSELFLVPTAAFLEGGLRVSFRPPRWSWNHEEVGGLWKGACRPPGSSGDDSRDADSLQEEGYFI